jgi:hypothetical protein
MRLGREGAAKKSITPMVNLLYCQRVYMGTKEEYHGKETHSMRAFRRLSGGLH